MAALETGTLAPDFSLPTLDGKQVTLSELLKQGPVVLAFFKISCPVCQFAFPFYERMAQAHKNAGVTVLGICQNGPAEAGKFRREFGVTFPIAIDDELNRYAVSNAYGLTSVPTLFYVAPDGEIELSSVGWSKREVDDVNAMLASRREQKPLVLWRAGEDIPEFRAG